MTFSAPLPLFSSILVGLETRNINDSINENVNNDIYTDTNKNKQLHQQLHSSIFCANISFFLLFVIISSFNFLNAPINISLFLLFLTG